MTKVVYFEADFHYLDESRMCWSVAPACIDWKKNQKKINEICLIKCRFVQKERATRDKV